MPSTFAKISVVPAALAVLIFAAPAFAQSQLSSSVDPFSGVLAVDADQMSAVGGRRHVSKPVIAVPGRPVVAACQAMLLERQQETFPPAATLTRLMSPLLISRPRLPAPASSTPVAV